MAEVDWPDLPYDAWKATLATLHMKLQIVGKMRLALSPHEPQWAHVPLYVTARGMTTGPMASGSLIFGIDVDLIEHHVSIETAAGETRRLALTAQPVAQFYADFRAALDGLGIQAKFRPVPDEVGDPIPFAEDTVHSAYQPEWATRFFRVLSRVDLLLKEHRSRYRGRTSPVHFFWGSFDLANTRFSGNPANAPPGAGLIARKSEDAEQICAGFWPGSPAYPKAAFYAYTYPRPDGIEEQPIKPPEAAWDATIGEFVFPYDEARRSAAPRESILGFFESTYEAGAQLRGWDRGLVVERKG